jgi:hypothetical protein
MSIMNKVASSITRLQARLQYSSSVISTFAKTGQ